VPRRGTAVGAALAGRVDDDGVAVRHDAVEGGVTAVSAPVRGGSGVLAAVSVVGPSYRMEGEALVGVRAAVAREAQVLSSLAGAAPAAVRTPNGRVARTP
jgi:DNA-binding IclR family transcriptional regulator